MIIYSLMSEANLNVGGPMIETRKYIFQKRKGEKYGKDCYLYVSKVR